MRCDKHDTFMVDTMEPGSLTNCMGYNRQGKVRETAVRV